MSAPTFDTDAMVEDAKQLYKAQVRVARVLGRLPDDRTRRKVLRAVCIMLDKPEICGDRPNF